MKTFKEFHAFYLNEHSHPTNLLLHFVGTIAAICVLIMSLMLHAYWGIFIAVVFDYGLAWIGHYCFQFNEPATKRYPVYSFVSYFVMFSQILTGRISIHGKRKI